MSKLDLKVNRGINYNSGNYSVNFEIINNDTSAVNVSAVRLVGYMWSQNRRFDLALTSGVNSNGQIQLVSNTPTANYPGVGQTGIVQLNSSEYVYRVNHSMIDSSKLAPLVTLNIPTNQSYIAPVSVNNRTDYYFDIVLTELPPNNSYSVTWFIPYTEQIYVGGTTALSAPQITITSATPSYRLASKKCDSKFIVNWNSTEAIPPSCGIVSASFYIKQKTGTFFESSIPENSWYSVPENSVTPVDNSYYVLEEWNGSAWIQVSEFNNYGIDSETGIGPQTSYQLKLSPTVSTSTNNSVYIAETQSNPIFANSANKDLLILKSTNNKTRSLIKFDTTSLPSSATSIRNAVLRLNVISTSGAWNYTNPDGHVSVHRITKNWIENEATWTNATSVTNWDSVGGDFDSTVHRWVGNTNLATNLTSGTTSGHFWMDFDVTDIVQYWKSNPSNNYGFLVKLHPNANESSTNPIVYTINSGRFDLNDGYLNRPELLIAYNVTNSNGPVPYVAFESPENNSIVVGTSVKISATSYVSGGSIVSVSLFRKDEIGTPVFVSNLTNTNGNNWEYTHSVSASQSTDILFLKAETDLGVISTTQDITVNFLTSPTANVGTSGQLCYSDSINLVGTIDVSQSIPTASFVKYANNQLPTSAAVFDALEDTLNPGVMWFITYGDGLWRYDSINKTSVQFTKDNSPLTTNILIVGAMKTDGNLFFSGVDEYGNGIGLFRFNTVNWSSYNISDWDLFDRSNSILNNYSNISIYSINVDSFDNIWIGLTWAESNSILKLTGNNLNTPFVKVYPTGTNPRSICCKNGVYIGYPENRISIYSSATDTFEYSDYAPGYNAREIDVDNNGLIYVCFIGNLSHYNLATSAWTTFSHSQTPAWPNGLAGDSTHSPNGYCNSIYIDTNNDKWFGFGKGNVGEYEGGVVKYIGSDFSFANITSAQNWTVYDSSNNISIPSNAIGRGLFKDSFGKLWASTTSGMTYFDGIIWVSPNRDSTITPITVNSNGTWNADLDVAYEVPLNLIAHFEYTNGVVDIPFTLSAGHTPTIERVYPSSDISIANVHTSSKLFEFTVGNVDFVHGEICNYTILKSIDSQNWFVYEQGQVTKNISVTDVVYQGQKYYYKVQATTSLGCSAESSSVLAYGNYSPSANIKISNGPYNTTTPIILSGNFFESDFGTVLSMNGYTSNDSVRLIQLSANNVYLGDATFTKYQNMFTSGDWQYIWENPPSTATNVSATVYDYFGKMSSFGLTLSSSVISAPNITLTNPPTSGLYTIQNANITLSATVNGGEVIGSLKFVIEKDGVQTVLTGATNNGFFWSQAVNVSSVLDNVGGVYDVFVSAVDINGVSAKTASHKLSANNLPAFTLTNPQGPACHNGTVNVTGLISDVDGNSNCHVRILSGSTILTSANTTGSFLWNWNNPPSGIHTLSAYVYDAVTSADYSKTKFVISAGKTPTLSVVNNFQSGLKNSITVEPKINIVSAGNVLLSAAVISSETTYVDFWNSDEFGNKVSIISASVPNNSAYIPFVVSNQIKYVLVEARTVGGCSQSQLLQFYVFGPTVELEDFTNCGTSLTINGVLDFDGISGSNQFVDNTFVTKLYANNTYVADLTLIQFGNKYRFNYTWENPIEGATILEFRCVNEYGNFSYYYQTSPIITGNVSNVIFPTSYVKSVSGIYIVSASSVTLSSSLNITDVKETQFIIETEDSIDVLYSTSNSTIVNLFFDRVYNIKAKTITNGGCEVYSDYISLIRSTFVSNITNINSTTCDSDKVVVDGIIGKMVFAVGEYGTSASDILQTEQITSAYVKDSFGNTIQTISTSALDENSFDLFSFDYSALVGTSALSLYTSSTLFGEVIKIKTMYPIQAALLTTLTNPVSSSLYQIMTPMSLSISSSNISNIASVEYYVNSGKVFESVSSPFAGSFVPVQNGQLEIYAKTKSLNGCYSTTQTVSANVTSYPVALITSPAYNTNIISGSVYNVDVLVSPSTFGYISAVNILNNSTVIGAASEISNNLWRYTTSVSASNLKARVYDSTGLSAESPIVVVNMIKETVATISASQPTYYTSAFVTISATGSTPNSATISVVEIYEVVNGSLIFVGTTTDGTLTIPASTLGVGSHTLVSKSIDTLGAYSYSSPTIIVVNAVEIQSYPTITYVGSNPDNLVTDYGQIIETTFNVTDNTFGILSASIGVVNGTLQSITSLNGNNSYQVVVNVSATGNVTLSALNILSNSATYDVNNYIFSCDGRKINLTNYVPNHLAFDNNGRESELITLTSFFEGYLNTLYTNLDKPCSLGVLEKTNRLRNLHDPDTMELDYIQFFANYLGYNVDVNKSELGGFVSNPNSSAYNDGPDLPSGFNEYQKKALRFVVRNLPNWYSIKTTRNAIKTLLLSFGIFGDLLEVYTNDYVSDWVINNIPPGTYVSNGMTNDRYPTPHMYVSIDINNTSLENIYGSEQVLSSVYKSFEAIRPANVVFEGLLGKFDVDAPPVYVDARYQLEGNMIIKNQMP
jgi:hypothetical protein